MPSARLDPAAVRLQPRPHKALPISTAEREGRLENLVRLDAGSRPQGLLLGATTSLRYFTGLAGTKERPVGAVVTAQHLTTALPGLRAAEDGHADPAW